MSRMQGRLRSFRAVLVAVGMGAVSALTAGTAHAATIVVYGASGAIGGLIAQEALSRGDQVIGVARDISKMHFDQPSFRAVAGDVTDVNSFRRITRGADAVIISVAGSGTDNAPENTAQAQAAKVAVEAYSGRADSPHVIEIGGASTMNATREAMLKQLPAPAKPGTPMYALFVGHWVALQTYRASHIRWTVLTPPLEIQGWNRSGPQTPKRTGKYRTSTTSLVRDAMGNSAINVADLAVAAVDEAEHPRFIGQRFTVGY